MALRPAAGLLVAATLALAATSTPATATTTDPGATGPVTRTRPPLFGAFVDGMQAEPSRLAEFEALVGARTAIASYYYGYGDVFPGPTERFFADDGRRRVLVSWHMDGTRFAEWTAGEHDAYLDTIAAAASQHPRPVWVRPWPEMNGDWQLFQPTRSGDRPEGGTYREFRQAWRYVVDYLRAGGATNLRWVFNPAADTYEGTTDVARIWPGRRYVDVLGIDGFNWGADAAWGRWRGFDGIFRGMYRRLTDLHPTAPVWICEFASKEPRVDDGAPVDPDRSKAAWIRAAMDRAAMPRVRAMVWFQALKERDWRVNSSRPALRAMRRALADR